MISVVVLTLNEERDLPGCLASVSWSDDVHVFDSFSSDHTIEIAKAAGAQIAQRKFDNYASHRNAALSLPTLRRDWVLFLDADERVPEALQREMLEAVRGAKAEVGAFRLRRRDYFMGRWLKHAQISPFYIRLFRRGVATYEREVNEVPRVNGRIRDLREHFDHFPFSKGLSHWVEKHNRYSTMEARCALATRRGEINWSPWRALFAKDFNERRFHQKELFYRLPARPLIKLLYMLIFRRAILDGRAGIRYALLQTVYEWLIVLKSEEAIIGQSQEHRPPPAAIISLSANRGGAGLKLGSLFNRVAPWAFYFVLSLLIYLSFRPAPDAASVPFIPHNLGFWLDQHDFIRNLFGFGCLALAGFACASFAETDTLSVRLPRLAVFHVMAGKWLAGMLSIVVLLEIGQTMLPRRSPHWRDVAAGWLAILAVWGVLCALRRTRPVHFATPAMGSTGTSNGLKV